MTKKLKFIVLLLICSLLNVNLAWGDPITTADLDFGTPAVSEDFEDLNTCQNTPGNGKSGTQQSGQTAYGIFTNTYVGKSSSIGFGIYEAASPFNSQYLKVFSDNSKYAGVCFTRTFASKGSYEITFSKSSVGFFGLYAAIGNGELNNKSNNTVYFKWDGSELTIADGNTSTHSWQSVGNPSSSLISVSVIYNLTATDDTYGDGISIASGKAHVYINGSAIMDGSDPKAFTIPANRTPSYFRLYTQNTSGISVDDIKIYDALPAAAETCTKLGQINGSINLTQGGTSVTIKDWSAVANAGTYTVKMYHYNTSTSEWDLVSGTSSSISGSEGTKTGVTNISTGVTFTGLTLNDDYRFSVQAIASSATYCDGDETFVTSINSINVSSTPFRFRYSICIDDGSGSNWTHHYITPTANANEGSVSINLPAHVDSYQFKIYGGFSGDWGQTGTAKIPSATKWTLNGSNQVKLHTGAGGAYVFTVDYSTTNPGVTVTFPSANQGSGYKIYFDKSIIDGWGNTLKYRIGNNSHNQNQDFTLVPGTDQFYVTTTPTYGSMDAWQIANNVAWTGTPADADHGIYNYYHSDDTHNITRATVFFDYIVEEDITMVPSSKKNTENSCDFWYVDKTSGMLTHNIAVGSADHGTVVATYTNTSGTTGQTVAEGADADLAHRCIVTITATPDPGYSCTALTVNGSNFTSGNTHILTADATIAATFTAKTYNITLDREGADNGSTSVTMTYNSATHTAITAPTKSGYDFGGWWTGDNGTGTMVMNASGVLQANVSDYTGAGGIWTKDATCTLYAKWTPVNYTITYHLNDGTNPGGVPTGFTIESALITLPTPTREGYNFIGWYANGDLSTGGVQTTIAAGSTVNKEYWAKWEIKKYTVTWHVGESTSTTSNVEHFTTFGSLSAPSHPDNALAACGSTKFIGWVKASGEYTEDGKTADWYNTHKFSSSDEITADTHVYAMYAEASGAVSDVLNTSNVNTGSTATNSWTDLTVTGSSGAVYKIHTMGTDDEAIRWNSNGYLYCSSGPTSGAKLQSVTIITTANKSIGIYGSTTAYSAKATATSCGNLSATSSGATYNFTSDYNYIGLNGTESSTYINSITISYGSYSNYRTGCTVSCGAPVLSAVTGISANGATISWTDDGKAGTLDHYEYAVWADGEDEPTSGFVNNSTTKNKALTGLLSNTDYNYKVHRVCTGDDNSRWSSGSFTTGNISLTFSVPTGASAVAGQNSNVALPTAEVPTDCGDCWAFAGWTTAEYAESSSAPAKLFAAGDIVHLAAADGSTMYAVYKKDLFELVEATTGLVNNNYYVLTTTDSGKEYAMSNVLSTTYATSVEVTDNVIERGSVYYIANPSETLVWKFTGSASSGRLYNESAAKYLDLSGDAILKDATTDNLVFTLPDPENDSSFDIASESETSNYLYKFSSYSSHHWGIDGSHSIGTDVSAYMYQRIECTYATSPNCPKYTVTWDINNGASTSTTDVTKCEGYLSTLPSAPADNTLSSCQTNGKFMGWSANKVMPAQDIAPADIFSEVEDAPEITENVTFYAVFANGVAGAATPVNTTYTFNSKSWGDVTNSWSSNTAGDELTSGRGIKIVGSTSAEGITKNNYTDVTKVVVTYCTNASSGTGSITVTVGDTEFGTNSISKPSSGGATLKTFTYTHAAATGKVKISASASTNSIYIYSVQIYYTGAGTVYEKYRTACCNDPGFSFTDENDAPVTEYTIVREDLASASAAVEIGCNYTSANTEGAITWYSTRRAALGFPATGAYTWTTPSSQPAGLNIDIANKKISASATGVWTITINQAEGGTTYCPVDAVVTVRVKTVDKFVDAVNGNFGGDAQRREDTGDGITLPTEAEFSIDDGCSTERRLLGWVKESDLSSYTSGYIDSWKTDDPATNKVIAPGTKVSATGITWYAVWGTEK